MTFNFGLATGIRLALRTGGSRRWRPPCGDTIASWPANQQGSFLTNHDQTRIMSELYGDTTSAKLAAFLLLTAPGTPFVYYGEEIGMTGTQAGRADPDADALDRGPGDRGLHDRDAVGAALRGRCRERQRRERRPTTRSSLLATYRDLVRVRAAKVALPGRAPPSPSTAAASSP